MSYFIGGTLYLPDPAKELNGKALAWAKHLEPILHTMHNRKYSDIETNGYNVQEAFTKFRTTEVETWMSIDSGTNITPEHLVAPSGLLKSSITHHAHQPTYFTLRPRDGETADSTNSCIAMIMGNVFQKGHSLIFDHICRREAKSHGLQTYPQKIVEVFLHRLRECMEAIPLWGQFLGINLFLDYESNYANAQPEYQYRRFVLFVRHPQRFMYNQNYGESSLHDLNMEVTAMIAGIPFTKGYFEQQRWRACAPKCFRQVSTLRAVYAAASVSPAEGHINQIKSIPDKQVIAPQAKIKRQTSGSMPTVNNEWKPHSVAELRVLLPKLQRMLESRKILWTFDSLPALFIEWLSRQWSPVFRAQLPVSFVELMHVHSRVCAKMDDRKDGVVSIPDVLRDILKVQFDQIDGLKPTTIGIASTVVSTHSTLLILDVANAIFHWRRTWKLAGLFIDQDIMLFGQNAATPTFVWVTKVALFPTIIRPTFGANEAN